MSSLLSRPLSSSRLRCPYLALHLGVCHGPTSLWLLSEAMEVGTVANLISSESTPLTWLQTVRLVCVTPALVCCSPVTSAASPVLADAGRGLWFVLPAWQLPPTGAQSPALQHRAGQCVSEGKAVN